MKKMLCVIWISAGVLLSGCISVNNNVMNDSQNKDKVHSFVIIKEKESLNAKELFDFENALTRKLLSNGLSNNSPELSINYKLIEFDPGSRTLRYFLGPFAGKATVKIQSTYSLKGKIQSATETVAILKAGLFGGNPEEAFEAAATTMADYIIENYKK